MRYYLISNKVICKCYAYFPRKFPIRRFCRVKFYFYTVHATGPCCVRPTAVYTVLYKTSSTSIVTWHWIHSREKHWDYDNLYVIIYQYSIYHIVINISYYICCCYQETGHSTILFRVKLKVRHARRCTRRHELYYNNV